MVTPLFATSAGLVGGLAADLGRSQEAATYERLSAAIRKAWLGRFLTR